jgi:hypothetical protein
MMQYNLAIQELNNRLDSSARSWELALMGSIVFIAIEVLQEHEDKIQMHLRSAFAILNAHADIGTHFMPCDDPRLSSSTSEVNCCTVLESSVGITSIWNYIVRALYLINEQVSSFTTIRQ